MPTWSFFLLFCISVYPIDIGDCFVNVIEFRADFVFYDIDDPQLYDEGGGTGLAPAIEGISVEYIV